MVQAPLPQRPDPNTLSQISDAIRRIRLVEESLHNIRRKSDVSEQTMFEHNKNLRKDVALLYQEVDELKQKIKLFSQQMAKLIGELQLMTPKEKFDTLQKYVDFWAPIKFVTYDQVSRLVAQEVEKHKAHFSSINAKVDAVKQELQPPLTPEQKKRVARFIEEHDDIHDMIMNTPTKFVTHMNSDSFLKDLFKGVNIQELSEKLKASNDDDEPVEMVSLDEMLKIAKKKVTRK